MCGNNIMETELMDNTELLEQIAECKCPYVIAIVKLIIKYDSTISTDDYGIAQVWCPLCDKGVTWDERKREKQ